MEGRMEMKQWDPNRIAIAATVATEGNSTGNESSIVDLQYHKNGHYLVFGTKDSCLHLVDSLLGIERKKIFMKTHGIGLIAYTHHDSCVLVTSTKTKHWIRYVSINDNKYLRYFVGHEARVVSLAMSPVDDTFLSASKDGVVFLWDLSSPQPIAKLPLLEESTGNIRVRFDSVGQIFGVLCRDTRASKQYLKLFSPSDCATGPFVDLVPSQELIRAAIKKAQPSAMFSVVEKYLAAVWVDFEFSPVEDGSILVSTNTDLLLLINSYNNDTEPVAICTRKNESGMTNLGFCFSADGKFIVAANDDKEIMVFDLKGTTITILKGHLQAVTNIKCNPKYDVMASTCSSLALWTSPM